MMKHSRWLFALAGAVLGLLWPLVSRAEEWTPPSIIISEVNWAGSSKSLADEWLELTNLSPETISLGGWTIEGASENPLVLSDDATIAPSETFLVANYDETSEKSALEAHPNLVMTSVSLSNSTLKIILKNKDGIVIDTAGNGEKPPAGTTGSGAGHASMVRQMPMAAGDMPEAWKTSALSVGFDEGAQEKGTPGSSEESSSPETTLVIETVATATSTDTTTTPAQSPNGIEAGPPQSPPTSAKLWRGLGGEPASLIPAPAPPIIYPLGTLVINEIMPNPTEGEEWVEIFNPYNNVIPLGGWRVRDASGRAVALPDQLLGWQQLVVVRRASGWLNNDAETIELVDPIGNVIDRMEYTKEARPEKSASIMRKDDLALAITTTPTPGAVNVLTAIPPAQSPEGIEAGSPQSPPTSAKLWRGLGGEPKPVAVTLAAPIQEKTATLTELPVATPTVVVASVAPTEKAPVKKSPTTKQTIKKTTTARQVAIRDLSGLKSGAKIMTEGIVTAGTETFGSQIAYIQSDGAGVQLFRVNGRFNGLKVGDRIRAEGVLGSSEGERRIKIQNAGGIHILESGQEVIAREMSLKNLDESTIGALVKIQGKILSMTGKKILIANEDGEIVMAPTERVRLPPEMLVAETPIEAVGIISTQNGELRLVPRSVEEVRMLALPPPPEMIEPAGKEQARREKEKTAWTLTAAGLVTLAGFALKYFLFKSV